MRILILLMLIGCKEKYSSRIKDFKHENALISTKLFDSTDPELESYQYDFDRDLETDSTDTPINFVDDELIESGLISVIGTCEAYSKKGEIVVDSTIGQCNIYKDGSKEIWLSKKSWHWLHETRKIIVIYHLLGHCALHRDHKNDRYGSHNLSIMYKNILNHTDFLNYKADYIHELKTKDHEQLLNSINRKGKN